MSHIKRLVFAIVRFLEDQLKSTDLSIDAKESLEVAIQCLETAYGVSLRDQPLPSGPTLLEIFSETVQVNYSVPCSTTPSQESHDEAELLKNQGNQLMKLEQHQEALECYTKAIILDGRNAIYYCNRAAAYSKLNDHRAAIDDCTIAVQIDPSYSKAYGRMGLALASLGDHRKAKECYEKALALDPTNESYSNNLKVADEKIQEQAGNEDFNRAMPRGGLDFSSLFANPALVNMATQLMQDTNMRNIMAGLMSNSMTQGILPTSSGNVVGSPAAPAAAPPAPAGPGGMDALLQAGQQLAAQMQASNPDLVDQLRRQMNLQPPSGGNSGSRENGNNNNNQPEPDVGNQ